MAKTPPKLVRDIAEDPEIKRLAAEALQRLDREDQSVVLPELCWTIAHVVAPENRKYISHAIKILLRDQFKRECRNADLYIPVFFKNPEYRGRRDDWEFVKSLTWDYEPDMMVTASGGMALLQCKNPPNEPPLEFLEKYMNGELTPFVYDAVNAGEGQQTGEVKGEDVQSQIYPLRLDKDPHKKRRRRRGKGKKHGRSQN